MKLRLKQTRGTAQDYEKFKELYEKLGIKIVRVKEFEVNLNFEEENKGK